MAMNNSRLVKGFSISLYRKTIKGEWELVAQGRSNESKLSIENGFVHFTPAEGGGLDLVYFACELFDYATIKPIYVDEEK